MEAYFDGFRPLDFISKEGKPVQGTQLFISYPWEGVTGEMTDSIFVRQGFPLPPEMAPGDILDISFNRKGKPEKVVVAKQKK